MMPNVMLRNINWQFHCVKNFSEFRWY